MPNWREILDEIRAEGSTLDIVRRKYLEKLHNITKRNIIICYSGWLEKGGTPGSEVNDSDKNGFMNAVDRLDRRKGLDLILHTPGGEIAATESIVDYLHSTFGTNIRAIVPQLAMSAGTTIVCACREVIMGRQSSLGPIDPQLGGLSAHGVIEEFERAYQEIKNDESKIPVWQPIIAKYNPTLIGECEKVIAWVREIVPEWLATGMFKSEPNAREKAERVYRDLCDHALMKSHDRHLSLARCKEIGLKVTPLEEDEALQDAVLSIHYACIHTFSATNAVKIIENHLGATLVQQVVAG